MKRISFAKKINIFIWAVLLIGSISFSLVNAATMWGRSNNYGYFLNEKDGYGGHVFNRGLSTEINSVNDLIYTLQTTYYKNGTPQEKVGAAFVANTLLGKNGANASRTVSDTTWNTVSSRLEAYESAGLIEWNHWVSCSAFDGINSYYQGSGSGSNPIDDSYYSDESCTGQQIETIYIMNADGSLAYALKYACGNPIGKVNMRWSIVPDVSVQSTANPGDTVTWTHKITVAGGSTNANIGYYYRNSSGFTSTTDVSGGPALGVPSVAGVSKTYNSTYRVLDSDIGKTFCRKTVAKPGSADGGESVSSDACVTIGSNAASGACRPIVINVPAHTRALGSKNSGHTGDSPLSVTLKVVNRTTNQSVFEKSYTSEAKVDLTVRCTTGDQYTATITIPSHTESWASYRTKCGTSPNRYSCTKYRAVTATHSLTSSSTIGPCYDYLLKPSILALSKYQVEVGATVDITPYMASDSWTYNNSRKFWDVYKSTLLHTKSKSTEWQVSRLTVTTSGKTVPSVAAAPSPKSACEYYKSKGFDSCVSEKTGSKTVFNDDNVAKILSGDNALQTLTANIADERAGTKVCFAFSVKPSNSENSNESATPSNEWYHSAVFPNSTNNTNPTNYCVIVVKKPKVQVLGGDIKVGRGFSSTNSDPKLTTSSILTINSVKSGITYGSWAEYGITAPRNIIGMASGAAFNGGLTANSSICTYSTLSFSNADDSKNGCGSNTKIGSYSFIKKTIPDISSSFPLSSINSQKLSGNVNLNNIATGSYTTDGNITITGGDLTAGKWIVINAPNNTVNIGGDIKYTDAKLKSVNDIPQLVIIAENILISNEVSQVDSWLIAKNGTLNTCSENKSGKLSTIDCDNSLKVNGPVMASTLQLRRTAGSGVKAASGDPAEIFNLRADAYLWAYARASGTGRVWTVYTTSVPPRL